MFCCHNDLSLSQKSIKSLKKKKSHLTWECSRSKGENLLDLDKFLKHKLSDMNRKGKGRPASR